MRTRSDETDGVRVREAKGMLKDGEAKWRGLLLYLSLHTSHSPFARQCGTLFWKQIKEERCTCEVTIA